MSLTAFPRGLLAVLVLASTLPAQGQELEVFPAVPFFPNFPADALAHQLSLSRLTDTREWIGAIGLEAPLLQYGDRVQWGVGATVFNRLLKTPGHITVSTVDYRVDFPADVRLDSLRLRAAYGHISSHYADDGIEQLGKRSISSVRDYLLASGAWMLGGGFLYATAICNYHNEPVANRKWQLQTGGEIGLVRLWNEGRITCAWDLKMKEDVGWGTTQSYQIALLMFEGSGRAVRLAYTHRRGFEERGQVFDQRAVLNLIGVCLDLR